MEGKVILATTFQTSWGYVGILGTEAGVAALTLPHNSVAAAESNLERFLAVPPVYQIRMSKIAFRRMRTLKRAAQILERAKSQVREYLVGRRKMFRLPLDPICGTPFARAVWRACAEIPYGRTCSYGWLAGRVGRPKAARAVGAALGANPLPLLIPCHRVVRNNGGLGGFGGGIAMKERLLALERPTHFPQQQERRGGSKAGQ
ncbi:MAG: methylated-DNA--[protein]-cysteine S-methyltransferase [Candidatus Sumerlaeia bacterium]|nr:methylated-DNA--[protein]-cysteine S-methyltransferase [Candidatus Sumerlaeia bacterium]